VELNNTIKRKVTQYFIQKWGAEEYRNGWYKANCPFCGKHKFGINPSRHKANCFSCGNKNTPLNAIMELEGFETKPQLYSFLKAFEGVDFLEPQVEVREWSKVTLPPSFRLLSFGKSKMSNLARKYMSEKRGFNIDKLTSKGIGYCTKGDYMGCIIFPFYQKGQLIYFIGRRFIQLGEGKFKNPSVEDYGLGKSLLTYNVDALAIYSKIYLVESIPNSLTMGDNAIAIMGKTISNYQLSMVLRSPLSHIVIALDDDALNEAIKLGLKLVSYKKVKLLNLPISKDINDIGKKATLKLEKGSDWLTYNDLLRMKHNVS